MFAFSEKFKIFFISTLNKKKMQKLFFILLTSLFLFSNAIEQNKKEILEEKSEKSVIEIDNCDDLFKIDPKLKREYLLKNSLDCKGEYKPIGSKNNLFQGKFDYNGNTVNAKLNPPTLTGSIFFHQTSKILIAQNLSIHHFFFETSTRSKTRKKRIQKHKKRLSYYF